MKLTKLYAILLGLMLLAACSKTGEVASSSSAGDEPLPPVPEVRYDSQFSVWSDATPMGTKLYFDTEDGNALKWTKDDRILLCNQSGTWKSYYVKDGGDTHAWLYFDEGTADLSGTSFYAVYPYPGDIRPYQDGVYSLVIPTTQNYTAGGFDPSAFPMVGACGAVKALQFKNAGAVLAIKPVSGLSSSKITSITVSANEPLAGACTATWDGDAEHEPSVTSAASTSVTLDCESGIDWGTTAYVCIAPGTYTDFCVEVEYTHPYYTEDIAHYTWRSNLTVQRSSIKKLTVDFTDVVGYKDLTNLHPVTRAAMDPQTANCYLITDHSGGKYRFPVTVKGNGVATKYCDDNDYSVMTSPKDITDIYVYNRTGKGACASTIFSEEPELIGDYVCFELMSISAATLPNVSYGTATATDAGTALIAASANPDWESGAGLNALWSWMVWYCPAAMDFTLPEIDDYTWLNINLGARATEYTTDASMYLGYYYQWGRKDPFQAGNAALSGNYLDYSSSKGSLPLSVANPNAFYGKDASGYRDWAVSSGTYYDWWNANQTTSLQTDISIVKTMWDPCPAGYRVMSYQAASALNDLVTPRSSSGASLGFGGLGGWGLNFPSAGRRTPGIAANGNVSVQWLAPGGYADTAYLFGTYSTNDSSSDNYHKSYLDRHIRCYAQTIRCEKE
ncbi:MAG: hypothetical protein K5651_07520 [Bacteroidales bacterium]|nr:hypothetical protein [Bacteroidales bacterium]